MSTRAPKENLREVRSDVRRLCEAAGRDPDGVEIVAVTKGFGPSVVRGALEAGLTRIGENRVSESLEKMEALKEHGDGLEWHMVGHLQSNKVRRIVGAFDLIHSIDRTSVVEEIDKRYAREDRTQDVLMQVNVSGESSKYGVSPEDAPRLLETMLDRDTLRVRGLMTMLPLTDEKAVQRDVFARCRKLRGRLEESLDVSLPELSMGMTNDYRAAVREGATLLRLGRRLFGERPD